MPLPGMPEDRGVAASSVCSSCNTPRQLQKTPTPLQVRRALPLPSFPYLSCSANVTCQQQPVALAATAARKRFNGNVATCMRLGSRPDYSCLQNLVGAGPCQACAGLAAGRISSIRIVTGVCRQHVCACVPCMCAHDRARACACVRARVCARMLQGEGKTTPDKTNVVSYVPALQPPTPGWGVRRRLFSPCTHARPASGNNQPRWRHA